MDPIRNPFAPGAGSQPPELAGRDEIVLEADIALQRVLLGRHDKSQILLGLRGVGKTVLLSKIEEIALERKHLTSPIEAQEDSNLAQMLYPRMHQVLRKLSTYENAKAYTHKAMRALRSFASIFKLSTGDFSLSVDPEKGLADSGNLELDLTDLFVAVGVAAQAAEKAWTLLIDEVQYLSRGELSALIMAVHRINQKRLPILVFAAGLPQIAALSGNAKSYAERLFTYRTIGRLSAAAAGNAIRGPIEAEGEAITEDALQQIVSKTQGYPYFLQEWGYQSWNLADHSPVDIDHVKRATRAAEARLDEGFFRVRFDRLTPKEKECAIIMAQMGDGPYRSGDVAEKMGKPQRGFTPLRASIIKKGMIYSPDHGDLAFTVPMFGDYLRRKSPPTT